MFNGIDWGFLLTLLGILVLVVAIPGLAKALEKMQKGAGVAQARAAMRHESNS